jgi:hypothetical protein
MVGSSAVLRLNFCAENPPLRKAAKRYAAFIWTVQSDIKSSVSKNLKTKNNEM